MAERRSQQSFLDFTRSLSDEELKRLVPQGFAIAS